MCQPYNQDICNGTVMPIYIKYDATVEKRETELYPQRHNCSTIPTTTKTTTPATKTTSNVDQDPWILVIIFTIGTIAVLAFVVYFLIHIFIRGFYQI